MSKNVFRRTTCRLCGSKALDLAFSLAPTPPANEFVNQSQLGTQQEVFPLDVFFCSDCSHVQILDVVDPSLLFKNYVYVSGTSPVFVKHFKDYADFLIDKFKIAPGSLVVEVGSNDGTLLRFFKEKGMRVLGIDPAEKIAAAATESGIETMATFFGKGIAEKIRSQHGAASLVIANNVFAHIDDLDDITHGVSTLLDKNGVFSFEVSYLMDVYEKTLFDTIYHEHLCYHSVKPLKKFFQKNDMELIETLSVSSHGGSLRGISQKVGGSHPVGSSVSEFIKKEEAVGLDQLQTFKRLGEKINTLGTELKTLLKDLKTQGKKIAGFGAPAKATTLMHHFEFNSETVDFIVDDSPLKQGLYTPGSHIPVYPSSAIYEKAPDYLLILAWNFSDAIMANHAKFKEKGGKFIVPLPKIRII